MSLRHVLLAALAAQPMTGYDLARHLDGTDPTLLWAAPHSQIYPELNRMLADGLVNAEALPRGTATKWRYTVTTVGTDELKRWLAQPLPIGPERNPHRARAADFDRIDPDDARRHLEEHRRVHEQRLSALEAIVADLDSGSLLLAQARLAQVRPRRRRTVATWRRYAYEGEIAHVTAEIAWARRGLDLLDELAGR